MPRAGKPLCCGAGKTCLLCGRAWKARDPRTATRGHCEPPEINRGCSLSRASGQGCSSRIALVGVKEPDLCIKEYAGILHLQRWFKFSSVWEINKYNLINVWLTWTASVAAAQRVETHVLNYASQCFQQSWNSCGGHAACPRVTPL